MSIKATSGTDFGHKDDDTCCKSVNDERKKLKEERMNSKIKHTFLRHHKNNFPLQNKLKFKDSPRKFSAKNCRKDHAKIDS